VAAPLTGVALVAFGEGSGKEPEPLWQAFGRLFERFGVTGVEKRAVPWARPHDRWKAHALEIKVWEVEQPKRGAWSWQKRDPVMKGEPGSLLLAVMDSADQVVVGVAFLARSAPETLVGPIRTSIESLQIR
jgi:hypothetical protein